MTGTLQVGVRRGPSAGVQTLKDSPQAHSCLACGFTIFRPPPSIESLNSSVDAADDRRARRVDQHPESAGTLDHVVVAGGSVLEPQHVAEARASARGHADTEGRLRAPVTLGELLGLAWRRPRRR